MRLILKMPGKKEYKAIAFDLDGTLVEKESSWLTIHEFFNTIDKEQTNIKAYTRGLIDFEEFMNREISFWPKNLHITLIEDILSDYSIKKNAYSIVNNLRNTGFFIIIVSAGIDILAYKVAKDLEVLHILANGLEIDDKGYLTGKSIYRVDLIDKHKALENYISKFDICLDECIAVGDSKYDLNFLTNCGLSIAMGNDEILSKKADIIISNLDEILDYLDN